MTWNKTELQQVVASHIGAHKFIVVSNREPYLHIFQGEEIKWVTPASGMALALDPVVKACGGTWIAHGSGDADREVVDSKDHIKVPPDHPEYSLRRVWLTKEEEEGYYYGFSNEALWPLCHIAYSRPIFQEKEWQIYKQVNEKFAQVVLEELNGDTGFVFIQDYHFTLLPRLIKEKRPDVTVAQFWHIPWPNREAFRICPWGEDILNGLLGNDLMCFHIVYHCQNFLDTVDRMIEAKVDHERSCVTRGGRETLVKAFPISVDFETINALSQSPEIEENIKKVRKEHRLKDTLVGIGIDRIDYIKGIPDRLRAIDRFFEKNPQYIGKFTFIQLGPLSRIQIQRYKDYNDEIYHLTVEINAKYGARGWKPIILHKTHLSLKEVVTYYRLADLCIVSSLHDGMNLVAKEFVSSRFDLNGALILSKFTGSSRELTDAFLINPYATDEVADKIKIALETPLEEKKIKMERMREIVKENNIFRWAAKIVSTLQKVSPS